MSDDTEHASWVATHDLNCVLSITHHGRCASVPVGPTKEGKQ